MPVSLNMVQPSDNYSNCLRNTVKNVRNKWNPGDGRYLLVLLPQAAFGQVWVLRVGMASSSGLVGSPGLAAYNSHLSIRDSKLWRISEPH